MPTKRIEDNNYSTNNKIFSDFEDLFERMRIEAEASFRNLSENSQINYLDNLTERTWSYVCNQISFYPEQMKEYRAELEKIIEDIYIPFMNPIKSKEWLKQRKDRRDNRKRAIYYIFGYRGK